MKVAVYLSASYNTVAAQEPTTDSCSLIPVLDQFIVCTKTGVQKIPSRNLTWFTSDIIMFDTIMWKLSQAANTPDELVDRLTRWLTGSTGMLNGFRKVK